LAVGDDQVAEFLFELGECAEAVVFGFEGEADDPAAAFFGAERGDDVVGFGEVQVEWLASLGDLVRLDPHRAIVAGGGGADEAVAGFKFCGGGGHHVLRGNDRHDAGLRRGVDLDGPADDYDFVPERKRGLRERSPHSPAGGVGQIADRVQILASGSGGDEDAGHWTADCRFQIADLRQE